MKIHFYLRFHTIVGQDLFITGNTEALGNNDPAKALQMEYLNEDFWQLALEVDSPMENCIEYSYILKYEDGTIIPECSHDRTVVAGQSNIEELQVIDTWNHAGEFENAFFSAPFQSTLLKCHNSLSKTKEIKRYTHIFKVKAPLLNKDEAVCLLGSGPALKEWETESPLVLTRIGTWWTVRMNLPKESFPISYKYGIYDLKRKKFQHFENGANRLVHGDAIDKKICILHDGFVHLPNTTWRGAGVAVPVFSLRSNKSFGVGEFTDLHLLVDWAIKTGLKLIQILPVNDTSATFSWADSYPYAAISAFALHPIYLNLETMAGKKHAGVIKFYKKIQKELNRYPELSYEEVIKHKWAAIKDLFAAMKADWLEDPDYLQFFEAQKHWLVPYAAFCVLRDRNGSADFTQWKQYSVFNKTSIDKFVSPKTKYFDEIAVQFFTQYHLHLQLRAATEYAHQHGIILKGDIPIGIYRYSCDAWVSPQLFHMDMQAGAPPDDFAIKGQNWGFPTYNWQQMEKDGFGWWKKRFEQMAAYFDAFRIDHILGFFRIWSIPMYSLDGVMGHFELSIPLHISEFRQKDIFFDYHRYIHPFINEAVIWEVFASESEFIKSSFLTHLGEGFYDLKEFVNEQRKVERHFAGLEANDYNSQIRNGLLDLIANVILFEEPGSFGMSFHFRIGMETTSSFRYLDWQTQQHLKELYVNYFFRRQDHFWQEEAMKKLPRLKQSTNMLVCGEDLGMVPACVPDVMKQLGILSLEIQRMPKSPKQEFFHPADAPFLSVITPSTHDMSTIRGWWEEDRTKTQGFFNRELGQWGDAPWFCEPWINKAIVIQHLYSPAMWSIFQIQDLFGMSEKIRRENPHDERINKPADAKNFWKYRMHLPLEDLVKEKAFNEEFRGYLETSGRA